MHERTQLPKHANLHGLAKDAAYEGLAAVKAALGLKHVHELALAYAAVGGGGFCSFVCPASCCHAAITPEYKPLHTRRVIIEPQPQGLIDRGWGGEHGRRRGGGSGAVLG